MPKRHVWYRVLQWFGIGMGMLIALVAVWSLATDTQEMHVVVESGDTRLTHVYINTPDTLRAANFYMKVFGAAQEVAADPHAGLLDATASLTVRTLEYAGRGPSLVFLERPPGASRPLGPQDLGYAHICFEADDVAAIVSAIELAGGKILSRFEKPGHSPVVYATDPDGNTVEVHVPLPSPLTPGNLLRSARALAKSYLGMGSLVNRARFLHVNINSPDWRRALDQYQAAKLGQATGVQRAYDGDFIGTLTGVAGAQVHGRHLALAGYSAGGPTLEIFTYLNKAGTRRLGLGDTGVVAIGFEGSDMGAIKGRIAAAGFTTEREKGGAAVIRDSEGNRLLVYPRVGG
jgi:catechol 2,3-dioxygenase-like lactoylglutathione lyase family enzyme